MRHGEQADEGKRANKARASFDARTANAASQSHKKSLDRSRPKSVLSVIIMGGERGQETCLGPDTVTDYYSLQFTRTRQREKTAACHHAMASVPTSDE